MAEPKDKKTETGGAKPPAKKPAAKPKAAAKPKPAAKPKADAKPKTEPKTTEAKPKATEATPKAKTKTAPKAAAKPRARPKPKQPEEAPAPPTVRARARYVRVAPRKARHLADQIRGMPIEDARSLLRFSTRSAARDVGKLLDSAMANAENNHDLVADDLRIAEIKVDEGPTLKRYRPRALGRATPIHKRTSHISLALTPGEED